MAEVENVSQVAAVPTTAPVTVTTPSAPDLTGSQATNGKNTVGRDPGTDGLHSVDNATSNDLGTSPTQEKSSNSHPHDSEYDTASDLEGGEEYDDDEDDMDDSLTDDDDEDDETESDDDDEEDDEGVEDDMTPQEKVDAEAQKKVDEDRSNPQYIPKRGTFYEHDDRTAEVDGEGVEREGEEDVEIIGNGASGNIAGTKSTSTPTISSASKTMKKWQPASAVDRWSHDRFELSEQAPKSRTELVSAYGYDIRTEDAPPKARRRRRYGRGPSKYNRNWEDESAYLKTNNKERKPPKPSDFPALNENSSKPRRISGRTREEKENLMERRQREGKSDRSERQGPARNNHQDDYNDRRERNEGGLKNMKPKSNFNRQGQATVGRQAAMEFKQKNRQNNQGPSGPVNQGPSSNLSNRLEAHRQPNLSNQSQYQGQQSNKSPSSSGNTGPNKQQSPIAPQQHHTDNYNKKKHFDQGYQPTMASPQTIPPQQQNQQQHQTSSVNHNVARQNSQLQAKTQIPTSNLSQRLQQVQNRNDPSHVGSVQMHALATQNQQQQQIMQQQQSTNMMMAGPQTPPQALNQSQEQRGPPKRYSSLRRSQHEAQHIAEHQQLQQLHMQQQQQATSQPAMLMPAEQAMLQANLMQMYHQENIQAQMQALQVSQQPNVNKPTGYAAPGPQTQPPGPYPGTQSTPAAYYVAPDAYSAASAAQATQQAASAYAAQQAAPNYLAQQQTGATLAYANPAPTAQQAGTTSAFGAAANVGVVVPQSNPAAPTAANYQNYNTVGGTTYFVPPPTQTSNRPVSLPQRRPTNAIPILPPSEKNKPQSGQQKLQETKEDSKPSAANQTGSAPIGSAENIDHIIDNMFVQRPAFQPPATTATTTSTTKAITTNEQSTTSSTENTNAANAPSSQDSSNNTQSSEKLTNDSAPTEISNNNLISTQE